MSSWNTTEGWNNGASGLLKGASAGMSVGGPIGAVVGGLAGGLSGLFGTKKKKKDWNQIAFNEQVRQFNVQDDYNKNRLQYIVKDANKAGINVEAALGSGSGHYSPTISAGGYGDSGSSGSFGGYMKQFADLITARREAKENRQIELENAELDLEGKRLQNDILRQQLMSEFQPGVVPFESPKNRSWRIPMDYKLRDIEPGQLFLPWQDLHGDVYWFINPDAISDADYSNIEADRALAIGAKGAARGARKYLNRNRKRKVLDSVNSLW